MTAVAPSRTAQRGALRRAAHQLFDHPRVFEDPLAVRILGDDAAHLASSTAGPRHSRAFVAARARFAEDELAAAIARGATQYVVLGAGLDTFGYRNGQPGLQVFEVDHPAAQDWKRNQLEIAGITVPSSVTYVPTDFEEQSLQAALESAGFQPREVTFFSWLGVTSYITAPAAVATLGFIGSLAEGSAVAFDYAAKRPSADSAETLALDPLASRVARENEPIRLVLDPRALARLLQNAGFHHVEDLGPDDIDQRYFASRSDGLQAASVLAHLVSARV